MKKILLILLLIISVGCNKQNVKIEQPNNEVVEESNNEIIEKPQDNKEEIIPENDPINIYLFWGDGCKACANLKDFFNNLDSSYNKYFNLVQYEIWYNEENSELMHKVGNYLNQTYYAIPFLVIGDEIIIGINEAKKEYILEKIIEEYNNDRYDVIEKLDNLVIFN